MHRGAIWAMTGCIISLVAILQAANAIPFYPSVYTNARYKDLIEVDDPEAVLEVLAKLGQSILRAQHEGTNSKRGLDLGLGRGFSGSQAAKHLMGLAAANLAAGPGKRKRTGPKNFDDSMQEVSPVSLATPNDWMMENQK
ncbi:unnamed protein product [Orchesella dallaii]|uniref:Diuretic hormone class 2 n=1 Tax=Orchesella dallaii TaxID=48710 RepID=A0ABP1PXN2_9HEXA